MAGQSLTSPQPSQKANYRHRLKYTMAIETTTLAGGCFWCLQPIFQELKGVKSVECGYSGGHLSNPTYQQVCTGTTGYAESIRVAFDPSMISFEELLHVFFSVHDPTTINRQGYDVGTQYRSMIFYESDAQKVVAARIIAEVDKEGSWRRPVVTEVTPFKAFYRAEEHHQDYFKKNPNAGYCVAIIAPKVSKFRKEFRKRLNVMANLRREE